MCTCLLLVVLFTVSDESTPGQNGIDSAAGWGDAMVTDPAGFSRIINTLCPVPPSRAGLPAQAVAAKLIHSTVSRIRPISRMELTLRAINVMSSVSLEFT